MPAEVGLFEGGMQAGLFWNRFVTVWLFSFTHAEDCCGVRCGTAGGQGSSINSEVAKVAHNTTHIVQSTEEGANLDAANQETGK